MFRSADRTLSGLPISATSVRWARKAGTGDERSALNKPMDGPNVIRALWSILWARRVGRPDPRGSGTVDHSAFAPALAELRRPGGLARVNNEGLSAYLGQISSTEPDSLTRPEALAFWLNVYNAAAVRVAVEAVASGADSVMNLPGAFDEKVIDVASESLSLNDIEHGKIRRFGDPRIHGALVCGSISCPTLRHVPFVGEDLDAALDEQMNIFFASGGVTADKATGVVHLSRVLLWYGADFVRPVRMPSLVPIRKSAVLSAVGRWLPKEISAWIVTDRPKVSFQSYDWGVGCSISQPTDG